MTTQEAIKILDDFMNDPLIDNNYKVTNEFKQAILWAIMALEKQMPDKIGLTGMDYWKYVCPNCGSFFTSDSKQYRYCSICGQAIDWEVAE